MSILQLKKDIGLDNFELKHPKRARLVSTVPKLSLGEKKTSASLSALNHMKAVCAGNHIDKLMQMNLEVIVADSDTQSTYHTRGANKLNQLKNTCSWQQNVKTENVLRLWVLFYESGCIFKQFFSISAQGLHA